MTRSFTAPFKRRRELKRVRRTQSIGPGDTLGQSSHSFTRLDFSDRSPQHMPRTTGLLKTVIIDLFVAMQTVERTFNFHRRTPPHNFSRKSTRVPPTRVRAWLLQAQQQNGAGVPKSNFILHHGRQGQPLKPLLGSLAVLASSRKRLATRLAADESRLRRLVPILQHQDRYRWQVERFWQ
jgi:hypothetical protein